MRSRFEQSMSTNSMPIPGETLVQLSHSATRVTRPVMSNGKAAPGSWMMSFTSVPTGSGLRVLMKSPPWLMLVAQSVRKLPTER